MLMYHGGSIKSIAGGYKSSKKKGNFEFGVGLYTCNSYFRCTHYSKSIKEIDLDINESKRSDNVLIPIVEVLEFIRVNCTQKLYKKALLDFEFRTELSAWRLQVYLVNNYKIHIISNELNQFFIDCGVDYSVEDAGNIILVHNFDIIKSIKKPEF